LKQRPVLGFFKGKEPKIEKPSVLIIKTCQRTKRNQKFCAQLFDFIQIILRTMLIYQTQLFDSSKTMVMNHKDCPL
jgi:hypothetical protein